MPTTLITAPAYEPVTLAQLKAWARIDSSAFDSMIQGIILPGLRSQCEHLLGRSIMSQTWQLDVPGFPLCGQLALPWPRLLAVLTVDYRDSVGAWHTLDSSGYEVDALSLPGLIRPALGASWPSTGTTGHCVRITYKAGYADGTEAQQQAAVPAAIKQWLAARTRTAIDFSAQLQAGMPLAELPRSFVDGLLDREIVFTSPA